MLIAATFVMASGPCYPSGDPPKRGETMPNAVAPPRMVTEFERDGAVARLIVDNAAKLNTLGSALMTEFTEAVAALAGRNALRAVVLTGAGGRAFIGGADIYEM